MLVAHEGDEGVRREAREGEEEVVVADERRRREERDGDDRGRRGERERGRAARRAARRSRATARPRPRRSARRRSSGVFTFVNERSAGSTARSAGSSSQVVRTRFEDRVHGALARGEPRLDDGQAGAAPAREQRLGPPREARDDGVRGGRVIAQEREQRRRDERHVARDAHDARVRRRRDERGVDAGERARAAMDVGRDLDAEPRPRRRIVRDDEHARERRAQRLEQALGDRAAVDDERGLRLAAEARARPRPR